MNDLGRAGEAMSEAAIALLDHVAQMDADPELDAAFGRKTSVALGHPVLHLDRAANGIDHATKLDDAPIAGALHYAPVVHGDGRIDQSLQRARRRASVRSSSEPASLLYPATSAARMAASFRVSAMAVPSPHARLARLLIGLYRLWVQHLIQHLLGVGRRSLIVIPTATQVRAINSGTTAAAG